MVTLPARSSKVEKLDPLLLSKKPKTLEYINLGGEVCGRVEIDPSERPHQVHHIKIFLEHCTKMYEDGQVYGVVPFRVFRMAVITHEMSHIMGETFLHDLPIQNQFVADYVDNVLDDSRDEYNLMNKAPRYSKFIQLLLASMRWATPQAIQGTSLQNDLNTLFYMARFGVIKNGADAAFVSFALPLVLSSLRGNRENTVTATMWLYEYLRAKDRQSGSNDFAKAQAGYAGNGYELVQVAMTAGDAEKILAGTQIVGNPNIGFLQDIQDAAKNFGNLSKNKLAGMDGPPPSETEKNDEFYDATCAAIPDTIIELRQAFLQKRQQSYRVLGHDGELAQKKLVLAYEDSIFGEEHRTTHILRKRLLDLRVVVYQDISDSTDEVKQVYAMATVAFLAALEDVPGVQTALFRFNSQYRLVQDFFEEIKKSRLYPEASGGTILLGALREGASLNWGSSQERYNIIITDGAIQQWQETLEEIERQRMEMNIKTILIEFYNLEEDDEVPKRYRDDVPGFVCGNILGLPYKMMDILTEVDL